MKFKFFHLRHWALAACIMFIPGMVHAEYTNVSPETDALVTKAHQSDAAAMEELGDIYSEGRGVEEDRDEAMYWYAHASKSGRDTATDKLWKMEGHTKRKVKRIERKQGYNKEATEDLCTYLYLVTQLGPTSLHHPAAVPKGIKTLPGQMGKVRIEEYKPAVVKRYLKKGADPRVCIKVEDIDRPLGAKGLKISPFECISRMHDLKTLDLLIAHGCCINQHGNVLVHEMFRQMDRGDARLAKKLLKFLNERGLNLNMKTDWASTRLIDCACMDFSKGVTYLAKQGLDPDAELEKRYILISRIRHQSDGDRSLGMAVRNKWIYTIDALLKAKADINYIRKGRTVLDEALAAPGEKITTATTYEEEFKRLDLIAHGTPQERKEDKTGRLRSFPNTNNINVAHLLRLAGAKTAAELGVAPTAAKAQ